MTKSESETGTDIQKTWVETSLPMFYRSSSVASSSKDYQGLAILLHGFQDHGVSFFRRLFPDGWPTELNKIGWILPNGPFPVPIKTQAGWKEAYSWYFFDEVSQTMIIPPDTSISGICSIVKTWNGGRLRLPITIIGFSQGGFLAPALARSLTETREIIAIGTGFREDLYRPLQSTTVTAIHGTEDPIFPVGAARKAHAKVVDGNHHRGEFVEVEKTTHVATAEIGEILKRRLLSSAIATASTE